MPQFGSVGIFPAGGHQLTGQLECLCNIIKVPELVLQGLQGLDVVTGIRTGINTAQEIDGITQFLEADTDLMTGFHILTGQALGLF